MGAEDMSGVGVAFHGSTGKLKFSVSDLVNRQQDNSDRRCREGMGLPRLTQQAQYLLPSHQTPLEG